jgi:CRISPR-associated protein Cas2
MRYLVCYDIADDRRRQHLVDVLLDYGTRVEESVFECMLEAPLAAGMTDRIQKVVDSGEDKVLVYGLCESCAGKVLTMGPVDRPAEAEFYIL